MRLIFVWGIVPLFCALFLYQATWQLAGFVRPGFVDFMRRYDRRPENPAHRYQRGRILDCNGLVLADASHTNGVDTRHYPFGAAACHMVGYADSRFGFAGVEKAENSLLSGYSLSSPESLKAFGKNIVARKHIEGADVYLTIDARLQQTAADLLKGRSGAVVAIKPSTGAIIVMVSAPGYDPNRLDSTLFSSSGRGAPLLNRALRGLYPPGSTFKTIVAAEALESGFNRKLSCPAEGVSAVPGATPIRDHEYYACKRAGKKWKGRGMISLEEALVHSSNVFFAQLGLQQGYAAMNRSCRRFHFNESFELLTGSSSMISSAPSKLPVLTAKQRCSLAQISIGQGKLLVTPLQMAFTTAVIGNDGAACMPYLKKGVERLPAERVMSIENARKLQKMMRGVVDRGTARGMRIKGLSIAAKTGTAQAPQGEDHSWFICMAPSPKPDLAIAVIVEHGGYGSQAALPIARRLMTAAMELGIVRQKGGG
jgi:peptidoglycan glycosyltransferase